MVKYLVTTQEAWAFAIYAFILALIPLTLLAVITTIVSARKKTVKDSQIIKLFLYAPQSHMEQIALAMVVAGAGEIKNYYGCMFIIYGEGRYIPGPQANAFVGATGEHIKSQDVMIGCLVRRNRVKAVLRAARASSPWEVTPAELIALIDEKTL